MAFPEPLELFQQWQTALDQFLETKTQPHPLHATYLRFYSAVSSEAIARLAHDLSPVKVPLLQQAKTSYQAAGSSLPHVVVGHEYHDQSDADTRSTCSTLSDAGSDSWNGYPSKSSGSSQHEHPNLDTSSSSSIDSDAFPQAGTKLKPSPLRIRKIPSFEGELTESGGDEQSVPPRIRPHSPPQQRRASLAQSDSRPTSITFSVSVDSWLQARSYQRYNSCLAGFAEVIANHISTIDILIQKTQGVQSARYFTKRLASYGGDEESRAANLRFRIARLKASGWKMERFAPERYQKLCAKALAEL
ncbi:MAG: hypothetical protein Q9175_000898 [Cornicularia normoerica]